MTAAEMLDALRSSLAGVYPAYIAERSTRPGAVTCVVTLERGEYDEEAACDPLPLRLTAAVDVLAAGTGRQAIADLLTHIEPVEQLIAASGWAPAGFDPDSIDDLPTIRFTATAHRT